MQPSHLLGAGALLAGLGLLFAPRDGAGSSGSGAPPVASGHCVLVVEGDRDALAITFASRKADPWAGVPKGFTSDWTLSIADATGASLAEVPLDVTKFATGAADKGQPRKVEGCIVTDARIAMLTNAPWFDAAASYTFSRPGPDGGRVRIGSVDGDTVRRLAGGGR